MPSQNKDENISKFLDMLRKNAFALFIIALCLFFYSYGQEIPPAGILSIAPRNASILKSFI